MATRISVDRTLDTGGTEQFAQLRSGLGVVLGMVIPVGEGTGRQRPVTGRKVSGGDIRRHADPHSFVLVGPVRLDHGPRVERLPGVGVTAEESGDGLVLRPRVRAELSVEIDRRAEEFGMSDQEHDRAGTP